MQEACPEWALQRFGLVGGRLQAVSTKPDRAVWRVRAEGGLYALKAVGLSPERMRFLTSAHAFLSDRTDLVPRLFRTENGELFADDGRVRYTLLEWVVGRPPDLSAPDDLARVAAALARFHTASRGFVEPEGSAPRVYLGRWPRVLRRAMETLERCRAEAGSLGHPVGAAFLRAFPLLAAQAEEAMRRLWASRYFQWCDEVAAAGGLCHQDFARGNLVISPNGVRVYDLDQVALDLPALDLRKLLNRAFTGAGAWDRSRLETVLRSYRRWHPLDRGRLRVLLADLTFPHLVCRAAARLFFGGDAVSDGDRWAGRLERRLAVELSKPRVLEAFCAEEGLGC